MSNNSKRCIVLCLLIFMGMSSMLIGQTRQIPVSAQRTNSKLVTNHDIGFEIEFQIGEIKTFEVNTKAGVFSELSLEDYGFSNRIGEPKLPVYSKIISVPVGAVVSFAVKSQNTVRLDKKATGLINRIIPAQHSISKSEDPSLVPFIVSESLYSNNALSHDELFRVYEIGYMRGVRVFQIEYEPIQYNPVTGDLLVHNNVTIEVQFNNSDFAATQELLAKTASYEFEKTYRNAILNWRVDSRPSLIRTPTKMLILCPPNYTTTLQPFVDWKREQGYIVNVTTVGTGGTVANTTSAINTYMAGVWSSATAENPAPTYLLIVGDTSTSGDNIIANTGAAGSHVTDLTYVRLNGTDYIPEMYYGRFSVSSSTELTNIINKTITFEKTLMPDLSYLGNVVLIAGQDSSYGPTWGDGQINYGTTHYFNATNGITSNTYLHAVSGTSDAAIIANANAGRGYMNYTAHGSETSWADPTFTVSDVNAMTNTNKYGVMVGNCCITNKFNHSSPCFGEAIIRKANAAGVVYIGATNNSYWDEDYWWGIGYKTPIQATAHAYNANKLGAYDAMFHTHSEAVADWAQTVGDVNYMGLTAVEGSTSGRKPYYWEIYAIMGDPSLMPYLGVPTVNTATYPSTILIGASSINVTAAPYSRVALTMGGALHGTAIVPANGSLTLTITPFSATGTAKLVITAQNKITVIANVSVAPNSGSYINVTSTVYSDTNNNTPENSDTGRFSVTFQNIGSLAASNATATLTSSTTGITITDNTESLGTVAAGASTTKNNAFTFIVADNIANGTTADFTITTVSGTDSWTHNFTLVINAPALSFGSMTISDPSGNNNGRLDPGETATISIPLQNIGAVATASGSATISSTTNGITINTGTANFTSLSAAGSTNLTFSITASAGMAIGSTANLTFNATAGAYTASKSEVTVIGIIMEGFETGSFSQFAWGFSGNANWAIDNSNSYAGTYSAKSGVITDNQTSTLLIERNVTANGNISFYYKVGSEASYDFLKFYIDDTVTGSWSGAVGWNQATYPVTAGVHTFKWTYSKDGSVSTSPDMAWIDDIVFPASTGVFSQPQNLSANSGVGTIILSWSAPLLGTPSSYKIYKNNAFLTSVTGLTYTDTAVTIGTSYTYYVTAVYTNPSGESASSTSVSAIPSSSANIQIGTGSITGQGLPIEPYYGYTYSQSLYLQSNINVAGDITKVSWYYNGNSAWTDNIQIYMGHTTKAIFMNTTDWIALANLTSVYTGNITSTTTAGWIEITLDTPFNYNNTQNLVIAIDENTSGYHSGSDEFHCTSTTGDRSLLYYSDSTNPDPTSPPTGTLRSYIPNTKLLFAPSLTDPVMSMTPSSLAFGNVFIGNSNTQNFTISNIGGGNLTGNITTPTGYSVALSTRNELGTIETVYKTAKNVLPYSISAGQSKVYSVTITPTSAQSYNSNITITSNDANNASVNLAVTGTGVTPVYNPPASLNAAISHALVSLSWIAPTGSSGTLTGYKVYRNSTLITSTPITTAYYNDSNVVNNTTYQYYITAVYNNPTGESTASNNVNATPLALAPQNLNVSVYHASVALSWQAPQNGTPYRYKVYRDTVLLATINGLTYTDIGLNNGTSYSYHITATYQTPTDESLPSNVVIATPIALPPRNLVGFDGNASVTLSWQAPSAGTPAFYRVMRNGVYVKNLTATTYVDSNLINGTTYNYKVKAMYSSPSGESDFTNTVYVMPTSNVIQSIAVGALTGQNLPMEPYQSYSYTQSIYLQSEINQNNKTINKLFWYYGGGSVFTDDIVVYMGHTDLAQFPSNSSWVPVTEMTQVYSGTISTPATADWVEIPLSTGFVYNNTQNLIIAVDENTAGRHLDTDEFHCYQTNTNRSISFYSMGTNTNPANPPTSGTSLTLKTSVPNLKLSLIDSAPPIVETNPTSLAFGLIEIGETDTKVLSIQNISSQAVTGTITTPEGYSIVQASRGMVRNTINFSLNAGATLQYNVTFAPIAVQTYSGNIVISVDNEANSTYQVAVSGTGFAHPTATLNTTEIDMTLSTNQTEITTFSICNTGSLPLTYSTSVNESPAWLRLDPASGSVPASSCFSVNVEFLATTQQPGTYNTEIELNSNDPDLPHQIIDVSLAVYEVNQPPVINLPASFTFNKNESLIVNFAPYFSDANSADVLTLSYIADRNLAISIEGTMVTFTSSQNWYGNEIVTFTINDGQSTTSDEVTINVLPTNVPSWLPVTYPNNPATVYAVITIDGIAATLTDQIAAFVDGECRGIGDIVINNGMAYSTMLVNLNNNNENVTFMVYDTSLDLIYQTTSTQTLAYGQVLGEATPYPISVSSVTSLNAPVVNIELTESGIKLSWAAVLGATHYKIYCSTDPYSEYTCVDTITDCEYIDTNVETACFYKVRAWDGQASRGGVK